MEQRLPQTDAAEPRPAYPTLAESWASLSWYLLLTIGLVALVLFPLETWLHPVELVKTYLRLGLAAATNALLVLWLRRRAGAGRWLKLRWRLPRRPWLAFGLLVPLVPALAVVLSVQGFLHLPHWAAGKWLAVLVAHPALAVGLGCVVGPLTEEVLFRGALLPGLLRNYRPAMAIGQSALLFGIFHLNPAQALNAFFIGLLLGWLYYHSRSLGLCIALHALYNALALGSAMLPRLANEQQLLRQLSLPGYVLLWLAAGLEAVMHL